MGRAEYFDPVSQSRKPIKSGSIVNDVGLEYTPEDVKEIDDKIDILTTDVETHLAESATLASKGHVQLATNAEVTTGTNTTKAVTPAGAKVELDKKLDLAGGTLTGNVNFNLKLAEKPEIKNYSETRVAATGVKGTRALNINDGNVFDMTLSGNTTFTFTNPAASGKSCSFTLILRQPSTLRTVTWPSSVKWDGDEIPEFVVSKTAVLTFVTVNGGTRWYGMIAGTEFTT